MSQVVFGIIVGITIAIDDDPETKDNGKEEFICVDEILWMPLLYLELLG